MGALELFQATVKRIAVITMSNGEIASARLEPARRASVQRRIETYHLDSEDRAIAAEVLKGIADRRHSEGAAWRDAKLSELAAELDCLRADLPRQAANAAIELGVIARNIKEPTK